MVEILWFPSVADLIAEPRSITGQHLSGAIKTPVPSRRRNLGDDFLSIQMENNLKT